MAKLKLTGDAYKIYLAMTGIEWFLDSLFMTVIFVYRATQITSDPFQLTLIEVVFTVTLVLFEIPTGIIADVFGRRLSVILGYGVIGVAAILQAVFPTLPVMIISQVVWALGFSFITGAKDAWIADEIGEDKVGKAYLRGSQIAQVALLVSIPIAAGLGTISLNLPIFIAGVGHILLAIVLILSMPETGFQRPDQVDSDAWRNMLITFQEGLKLVRSRSILASILLMTVIFGLSSAGFDNLWTVHLLKNYSFPAIGNFEPIVWFGAISTIVSILGIVGTELVHRKVDVSQQRGIVQSLTILTSAAAIFMILFGLAGNFWLAAAAYCLALTLRIICLPLIKTWINLNVDSNVRATMLSLDEQAFSLGESIGGPAAGAIGSLVSLPAALVAAGLIRLPAIFIFLRVLFIGKQQKENVQA